MVCCSFLAYWNFLCLLWVFSSARSEANLLHATVSSSNVDSWMPLHLKLVFALWSPWGLKLNNSKWSLLQEGAVAQCHGCVFPELLIFTLLCNDICRAVWIGPRSHQGPVALPWLRPQTFLSLLVQCEGLFHNNSCIW